MSHRSRTRVTILAPLVGCLLATLPALPAHASAPTLPTAAGTVACGRLAADAAALRAATVTQRRDARLRPRTTRQKVLKAARLRKHAIRVTAAAGRLRADTASCGARWQWPSPKAPRLDQGRRPTCGVYAALQELNARGTRITQTMADQISDEVSPEAPSASWTTDDMVRAALARRGVRVSYQHLPATADAALIAVRHGPVTVGLRFSDGMDDTDRTGHWTTRGSATGLIHAVVLVGYDPRARRVLLLNQWGRDWGADGGMWLTPEEFASRLTVATVWTRA